MFRLCPPSESRIAFTMKVCFLVGTLGRGGAERQLVYMLRALKKCEINTRVLCLTKGESYEDEINALGVPIEWIGKSENRIVRLLQILTNLRRNPADVLQSSHFYTNIYVGAVGKFLKIPSIGAIRSDLFSEVKLHKFLGGWQISLPNFLIVNSMLAFRRAIETGLSSNNVEFVRNVVEAKANNTINYSKTNSVIRLLFVGRLDKNKRPERFIRLAEKLIGQFPQIALQFQIAGDGVLRGELELLAQKLNLSSEKLEFLGVCSDMSDIYRKADILVSTSEREGTSNVILEAMAYGLPVIATNVGGTPDILNEKCGILVEPAGEKQLFTAAEMLILDKDLRHRMGSEGQRYVKQNHSVERLQTQLENIYQKLIA